MHINCGVLVFPWRSTALDTEYVCMLYRTAAMVPSKREWGSRWRVPHIPIMLYRTVTTTLPPPPAPDTLQSCKDGPFPDALPAMETGCGSRMPKVCSNGSPD